MIEPAPLPLFVPSGCAGIFGQDASNEHQGRISHERMDDGSKRPGLRQHRDRDDEAIKPKERLPRTATRNGNFSGDGSELFFINSSFCFGESISHNIH